VTLDAPLGGTLQPLSLGAQLGHVPGQLTPRRQQSLLISEKRGFNSSFAALVYQVFVCSSHFSGTELAAVSIIAFSVTFPFPCAESSLSSTSD
jgi:hypothetical protein